MKIVSPIVGHMFLYSKGWYARGNVMEDLQRIICACNGLDHRAPDTEQILSYLVCTMVEHAERHEMIDMLRSRLFDWLNPSDVVTLEQYVGQLLALLSSVAVNDGEGNPIIQLPKPDFKILKGSNMEVSPYPEGIQAYRQNVSVQYVWYSWSKMRRYWARSCWKGMTVLAAEEAREQPMACELNDYNNVLVREVTVKTALRNELPRKTKDA